MRSNFSAGVSFAAEFRGLCFRRVGRAVATLEKWIKFDYHCSAYFARLQRVADA